MTNFFSSKVITAKAKAMYGKRLTAEDYNELMHRQTVSEVAAYLKNETQYKDSLQSIQESMIHRGQLENLLRKDVFRRYLRLIRYDSSKRSFYHFVVIEMEITQLLNCIRHLNAEISEDLIIGIPGFLFTYADFDMMELAKVKTYSQLLEVVRKTPYYDILSDLSPEENQKVNLPACEIALEKYYFDKVTELIDRFANGNTKKTLTLMLASQAELKNITAIYRLKRFFSADEELIKKYILPFRFILKSKTLDKMVHAADLTEFFRLLRNSKYSIYLTNENMNHFDDSIEMVRYRQSKKNIRFSTDAKTAFLAYVILSRMELQNIINVVEGVRYELQPEEIESLLII